MTRAWPCYLILLAACIDPSTDSNAGTGGKADDPHATFGDVVTQWELPVGEAGDAVLRGVSMLPDGTLLATSHFPEWVLKVTADGARDRSFGDPSGYSRRTGSLHVSADELWQVNTTQFVAAVGDGGLFQLRSYLTADGSTNTSFGTAGSVALPYNDGKTIALEYDKLRDRIIALVVRTWHPSGPSKIELLAFDAKTGAVSPAGTHDLPLWESDSSSPVKVRELVVRPDGSHLIIVSEPLYTGPSEIRANVATRWSMIHLRSGKPPERTTLAVTEYGAPRAGFLARGDGGFDLYLTGIVDDVSTDRDDRKLVRISVDAALTPELGVVGGGIDLSHGCAASIATPTYLLYGHAPDRDSSPIQFTAYPKTGAPISFASDRPKRCLLSLTPAPGGHIYAGTWDTTNTGWNALLSSFAPE